LLAYREFPGVFIMVNSGNFMNLRHTGNSLFFFHGIYREFPGDFFFIKNSGNFMNLRLSGSPLCPLQTKEKQILKS
jgi:hypothetical protein